MQRIMQIRLFRSFFHGLTELDAQIAKFRQLRDSCRPGTGIAAGAWPVRPCASPERPSP